MTKAYVYPHVSTAQCVIYSHEFLQIEKDKS